MPPLFMVPLFMAPLFMVPYFMAPLFVTPFFWPPLLDANMPLNVATVGRGTHLNQGTECESDRN